ncbi:MAG: DUF1189 domain-containing protein [Nitrospiraceae bacterium]|nr:DUF1189 domain-containing protein [Nitrospiraceae bacterium]
MQRFTIIHPLYMSFFSKALYRDVGRNWKGHGFVYLFALVAFCMIPFVLITQSAISDFLNNEAPKIIRQMPDVTINKGKLSIDRPEPYFVRDEKTGEPLILFDADDKADLKERAKVPILVLRSEIIVRGEGGQVRHLALSDVDGFHSDRRLLYDWLDALDESMAMVLYPFAVAFSLIFRVLEVVVFAAAGRVFAKSLNARLTYPALMRLSAVALTPPMMVGAVFNVTGVAVPFWWIAGIPITLAFLYYGIRAVSEEAET